MSRPYKFVYLGNYVINIIIVVSLLSIHWLGLDLPDLKHFLDMGICCMGTWMVLSLFSRSFIVNDAYKGHRILDARTTRQLTILLAIAEAMALYCSGFGLELYCSAFVLNSSSNPPPQWQSSGSSLSPTSPSPANLSSKMRPPPNRPYDLTFVQTYLPMNFLIVFC